MEKGSTITESELKKIAAMTEGGNCMGALALVVKAIKIGGSADVIAWLEGRGCPADAQASGEWWDSHFDEIEGQLQMKKWLPTENPVR